MMLLNLLMLKKKIKKLFKMKTAGIVLVVIGALSTLGAIIGAAQGYQTSFAGLTFVVLGAFLISRANNKKEEEEKKRQWEEGSKNNQ